MGTSPAMTEPAVYLEPNLATWAFADRGGGLPDKGDHTPTAVNDRGYIQPLETRVGHAEPF
jgi:hypothetical protein